MTKSFVAALTVAAVLGVGAAAHAQMNHGSQGGHGMGAGQHQGMGDMDGMMGMMRQMMPMMERMQNAPPAERERLMGEMRTMMRDMMPMMQALMPGSGMPGPGMPGPGMSGPGMSGPGMSGPGMSGPGMSGPAHEGYGQPSSNDAPSTKAFEEANAKMHRDMAISFTGNADTDFVRGMIPHHQGAIDMSRVVLQYGSDEQTKKWANEIIAAQEREIAEMRDWLARNAR